MARRASLENGKVQNGVLRCSKKGKYKMARCVARERLSTRQCTELFEKVSKATDEVVFPLQVGATNWERSQELSYRRSQMPFKVRSHGLREVGVISSVKKRS